MTDIEITPATLVIHIQGFDQFFADVHDPDKAIAIRLHDEHYAKPVVSVDDPPATAQAIAAAIPRTSV
jgi:hypothetical protein